MAYVHTEWYVMVHVNDQVLPACIVCGAIAPPEPQEHTEAHSEFAIAEAAQ